MSDSPTDRLRSPRRRSLVLALAAGGAGAVAGVRAAEEGGKAQFVVRPWPADRAVPALALTDLQGTAWDLKRLEGRPVLLNFWATWCEPCRAEMPSLDALAGRHAEQGLTVLAVNYQDSDAKIREFLAALPIRLPVLLDRDGEAARAWTPRVFPSTVLIDRRGRPVKTVLGELDWGGPQAAALVEPLLARSS